MATGDIGTLIRLITKGSRLSPSQFVSATIGPLRFMYYAYLERFHRDPADLFDLVDGMLYIEAVGYRDKMIHEDTMASINARAPKK